MFKGHAESKATRQFLEKHSVHPAQLSEFCGIPVSRLALGTYLGRMDDATDAKVTAACVRAAELGCNFFDTAINYRGQRSERAVGEAIRRLILLGAARREELFVSSKAGFVPYEGAPVADLRPLFDEQYVKKGLVRPVDLIAGCHCLEPAFIADQLERSRKNLQLETIDLYYLHNPETQLEELPERIFYDKLEKAFMVLEHAVSQGKIGAYGIATWSGLRDEPGSQTFISLEKTVEAAQRAAFAAGADSHQLRAVQLPLNLAMPEAALIDTQSTQGRLLPAAEAAQSLGLSVAVSAPLFQARLCQDLPEFITEAFPSGLTQAGCALSFATAFEAVNAAMLGMKQLEHVEENLAFLKQDRLSAAQLSRVIQAMVAPG